jgi:hypothetical protein
MTQIYKISADKIIENVKSVLGFINSKTKNHTNHNNQGHQRSGC